MTVAALGAERLPARGQGVPGRLQRAATGDPEPYAIFGYEAMSLMLNAITRATDNGTLPAVRSKVRKAIFATRDRHGVLGTYGINAGWRYDAQALRGLPDRERPFTFLEARSIA